MGINNTDIVREYEKALDIAVLQFEAVAEAGQPTSVTSKRILIELLQYLSELSNTLDDICKP